MFLLHEYKNIQKPATRKYKQSKWLLTLQVAFLFYKEKTGRLDLQLIDFLAEFDYLIRLLRNENVAKYFWYTDFIHKKYYNLPIFILRQRNYSTLLLQQIEQMAIFLLRPITYVYIFRTAKLNIFLDKLSDLQRKLFHLVTIH